MYLESGIHMQQESFGRAVNGGRLSPSGPWTGPRPGISRSFRWSEA